MDICLQTDVSAFNILSSFVMGPSLVDQIIKNLPATQEMWVQSLGQEDPLEKGMQPTVVLLPGEFPGRRSLAD